uniref:Regulator of G protein signalling-like domain-containing protein n=1 Tax=Romanomermis culicivorax TaxID=13658 RepID=A0A915L608_ROMCU
LFFLISDLYSSVTNSKDSRRWAYEIHSTFLTPTATSAPTSNLLKIGKISQARLLKMTEIVPNHCTFYYLVILQTSEQIKMTSKLLTIRKLCQII